MDVDIGDSKVTRLINQCKANDIDARVDAVTKLQAEFEAGTEIPDPDALLAALKTCLKTANQHLTTATLAALPPLLPLLITRAGLARSASAPAVAAASPTTSTSSATAPLIDVHALRQALAALLSGGLVERLGDSRERAREKARETLVILGGLAFRGGGATGSALARSRDGKGAETPLQMFERSLREQGLASKVWRVREQSILALVHLRRAHHLFPIRPFLPALVALLEDTDGNVRECTRQSVVELFTGPGVTDVARADLKKEMAKQGVRKTIVDGVLARVLAGGASTPGTMSDAGSENGDAGQREYVPPSIALMNRRPGPSAGPSAAVAQAGLPRTTSQGSVKDIPRPASRSAVVSPPLSESTAAAGSSASDVKPVYIASVNDLQNEFASMLRPFESRETEHNWAPREQAIQRVRGMIKGEVHERYTEAFLLGLKTGFINASLKTLASLRTTVAANTCSLYAELAVALGTTLDPFCDTLLTHLLRMASLTKKIIAQQSQATVDTILTHTSPQVRLVLPMLFNCMPDKNVSVRQYAVGHLQVYMEVHGTRSKHAVESAGGVEILEKSLKKALSDANIGVRESVRKVFWVFNGIWPDRGAALLNTLDASTRKQVEKACPNPGLLSSRPAATPVAAKKSSVAAAIAASRAKAKAIATAPPSLRHQATSTSHAARAMSPTGRRAISPSLSTSSSTGAIRATSPVTPPSPPRSRIVSGTMSRSVSSSAVPPTRSRVASGSSQSPPRSPPPPPPPTAPEQTTPSRRRISSSPLVVRPSSPNGQSTFRRALQTALPASPPSSAITFGDPDPSATRTKSSGAIPIQRESLSIAALRGMAGTEEESLLLAAKIPIPEDSDSEMDMDESVNLMSFSAPYELYPPPPPLQSSNSQAASFSPHSSSSKPGPSNTLSTSTASPPASAPSLIVEDALRARAEQAESAAERLLELVEPEEESMQTSSILPSLLRNTAPMPRIKATPTTTSNFNTVKVPPAPPKTPVNRRTSAILKQAALLQDSPAPNGKIRSLFDMVGGTENAAEWWGKCMAVTKLQSQRPDSDTGEPAEELQRCISSLEQGSMDVPMLKNLALLCMHNPVEEPTTPVLAGFSIPSSPSPFSGSSRPYNSALWNQHKNFDRLFKALIKYLDPQQELPVLEYGLIVLWEMLANQAALLEGKEADIFNVLLNIRYCARTTVMQATNMFRDALTSRIEPVYGLTTLHASLRAFWEAGVPPTSTVEVKDGTYAFGLIALGKFILRLPPEVLEDELPRLRSTLIAALTDASAESSLMVREAAAASIIAAQLVLRDETHLFALLDGLPDDKKNLLTYLFDKHGSRGTSDAVGPSGIDRLEREMRRLDNRTNTPPRTHTTFVSL